jgi:hypothetical protein
MKLILISLAIVAATLASVAFGQSPMVAPPSRAEMAVEVAEQANCPLKLSIKVLDGPMPVIDFEPSTLSNKSIIGYIIVGSGETKKTIVGTARPGDPVERDTKSWPGGMVMHDQKHVIVFVDYVEFADGSSWGEDAYKQSGRIKQFVRSWSLGMERLREIVKTYEDPEFFIHRGMISGRTSWSGPVMPNADMPRLPPGFDDAGYDTILRNLRLHVKRDDEAQEIARKLELMRMPAPVNK